MGDVPAQNDVFRVVYPFVKEPVTIYGNDGEPVDIKSWRPGVSVERDGLYEDVWAESQGEMILTVISTHKPGRFPTRVFFTRQFVDPDGKTFGKGKMQICTLEKFRRISARYRLAYDCEETFEQAAERRQLAAEGR